MARLVALLVAQIGGIELGLRAPVSPGPGVCAAAGLAAVAAACRRPGTPARIAWIALVAAAGLGAAAVAARAVGPLRPGDPAPGLPAGRTATVALTLVEDPSATRWSARALARLDRWTDRRSGVAGRGRVSGRRVVLAATGAPAQRLALLDAGDRVQGAGWWGPLRPWERHLRWRHAAGRVELVDLTGVAAPVEPWTRVANGLRRAVLGGLRRLPADSHGLTAGLLLGDTRALPPQLTEAFRAAGMSHLLVVSGSNVAFTLGLLAPFLRRLGPRGRAAAGIAALGLFGTMTRWEPSVTRAVAMAAIAIVASTLGRPQLAARVLVLAVIALCAVDPLLARSAAFRLSVAATAGITVAGPPLRRLAARLPHGRARPVEALVTPLAAQVGVTPVLLATFGRTSFVALPANVVAAPLAGPLVVCGLVTGLLAGPAGPELGRMLVTPAHLLAVALRAVAVVAAGLDAAVRQTDAAPVAVALGAIACVAGAVAAKRRRRCRPAAAGPRR
jgi:competence protein ComEC